VGEGRVRGDEYLMTGIVGKLSGFCHTLTHDGIDFSVLEAVILFENNTNFQDYWRFKINIKG